MPSSLAHSIPGLRWAWRAAGVIGCLGYAALALVSGLDREAVEDTTRPTLVNWPYAVASQFGAAVGAIKRHDPAKAVVHGSTMVRHDPANSASLSLYGLTLIEAHQPDKAREAFLLAGRLGWRDAIAQRYWFNESLRMGDAQEAARHLDALLRRDPDLPGRDTMLRAILAYTQGRAAIADRLKVDPGWAVALVSQMDGLDIDDLDARAEVVQRAGPTHYSCAQASNLMDALVYTGLLDDAAAVHRTLCPDSGAIINDQDFNALSTGLATSSLDWNLLRRGDMVISVNAETSHTHMLSMSLSASSTVMAAWQTTVAGPGLYQMTWRMPGSTADDAAAFMVSFNCGGDQSDATTGTRQPGSAVVYGARIKVPDTCLTPTLRFWIMPNRQINVAGLRIARIRS